MSPRLFIADENDVRKLQERVEFAIGLLAEVLRRQIGQAEYDKVPMKDLATYGRLLLE